jgi:preprotein translocase subunit YajC
MMWLPFTSVILWILPILIIAAVVYFAARSRQNQQTGITPHQVLVAYFYLITAVSVITMVVGAFYFAKVAAEEAFGIANDAGNDLALASILFGTGAVVCILHVVGRRQVEKMGEGSVAGLRRLFLFSMLSGFGIAGLISLPVAIYQVYQYYHASGSAWERRHEDPSTAVAAAIVLVFMWAYYMFRVLRELRERRTASGELAPYDTSL